MGDPAPRRRCRKRNLDGENKRHWEYVDATAAKVPHDLCLVVAVGGSPWLTLRASDFLNKEEN